MNSIQVIGRLTRDVEIRTNEAGTTKGTFTLAVNRPLAKEGTQQTDFIPCVIWNKLAENLARYQGKGCQIAVEGSLHVDQWQDEDEQGNTYNRTYTYIQVNRCEYLSKIEHVEEEKEEQKDLFKEFSEEVELTDEDLPF